MKTKKYLLTSVLTVAMLAGSALGIAAQHKHTPSGPKKAGMAGMKSEMSKMMKSPHHMLMMAHMKSMSEFARTLRDQAVKPQALDVEFARANVAELRHNLDAMEAIHQKHMQAMMEKMDKERAMVKDQVSALETDVLADTPDSKQVAAHTNALLKHFGMMSKMHGMSKAGKRMGMKKREMKM